MSDLDLDDYTRIAVMIPTSLARALVGLEERAWAAPSGTFSVDELMALSMTVGHLRDSLGSAGD
jgi:hypothetical protein